MSDKVNPDRYTADFEVNPDGLVVHGSGPADGAYALRRANRSVDPDRPKVEHRDYGNYHGTKLRGGTTAAENPDLCPTCHLEHPPEEEFECAEIVEAAHETFPQMDPDKPYAKVTISYLCDATMDEVDAAMPAIIEAMPKGISGMVGCTELPFLLAAKDLTESLAMSAAVELATELADEQEVQESAVADEAAEFLRKASSN